MSDMLVRVQEKGQVTIPSEIRKKLNLRKGDLVMFVETEAGFVIKPAEIMVSEAMDEIGRVLEEKGVYLEEILERAREKRSELIKNEFDLEEK